MRLSKAKWLAVWLIFGGIAFAAGVPAFVVVSLPTEIAVIGTPFPAPLTATVQDSSHNPVPNVLIVFSAPGSGPSGTFSNGTATITVTSGADGTVSAGFTANSIPGTYSVTAATLTTSGIVEGTFQLTNSGPALLRPLAGTSPQSANVGTSFNVFALFAGDSRSLAVPNLEIDFAAPSSGASATFAGSNTNTAKVFTDSTGVVQLGVRANSTPGPYTVTATTPVAPGLKAAFALTNLGPVAALTPFQGTTPQTARVGTPFQMLNATLTDSVGDGIPNVIVNFSAPASGPSGTFGNGTTSQAIATNALGQVFVSFQANNLVGGPYIVRAAVGTVASATFSLTNQGAPVSITTVIGSTPQSAPIGAAFPNPLAVTVKDPNSAGVAGTVVTFTAPSSGPSCVFGNSIVSIQVTTDATGTATAPIQANALVGGPYAVQASTPAASGGLLSTTFALTNTGGAPVVTKNPVDVTVAPGLTATFSAAATGSPSPTVQWQQSTNAGSTFADIPGATATTLSFPAAAAQSGNKYHAVFTNTISSATTTAATLTVQSGPTIRSATPVIPSFLGATGFSSNMYLEIYGSNFTTNETRQWAGSDFNGLLAPTSLDGVSVQVNGKSAYVYFISPGQININVPDDNTIGPVTLQVFTPTPSNTVTVQRSSISPTLQTTTQFNVGGKQYVVALTPDFQSFIGQPGLIAGASFVLAKPGDTILIYALGAGPTNPATQAGVIASVSSALALPFQLKIGGVQAATTFAGLLANTIGLYQLNVVVPQVPAGDQPIEFIVNGVSNNQNLVITIGP